MDMVNAFRAVLQKAIQLGASDVHVSAGGPFRMRLRGQVVPVTGTPNLEPGDTAAIAGAILLDSKHATPQTVDAMVRSLTDLDCSYSMSGSGRFRVNLCSQRGSIAATLRNIPINLPDIAGLNLPPVLQTLAEEDRGLILVTGVTGSGKSSTLAAMLSHINKTKPVKAITIEDPIEFLYKDDRAIMIQRELGGDTDSFARALRAALRQDPDIIMVGEMRDMETVDIALKAAETGHLVFSTVHTSDAVKTISRLVSVFPAEEQPAVRMRLAETLRGVISQRLLPRKDGQGRVPAVEVMRNTPAVADLIMDASRTGDIKDLIVEGRSQYGMQTFDQHLMDLYKGDLITAEVAKAAATSPADFARNLEFQ
jgi:twitching motility protein PilT